MLNFAVYSLLVGQTAREGGVQRRARARANARDKRSETNGVFQMRSEHMPAVGGDNYEIGAELLTRVEMKTDSSRACQASRQDGPLTCTWLVLLLLPHASSGLSLHCICMRCYL